MMIRRALFFSSLAALLLAGPARGTQTFSVTDTLIAEVADVAFLGVSDTLLVASAGGAVSAWDIVTGERLWHRPAPAAILPAVVVLAPFLRAVVLGDGEGSVHLLPWAGDRPPLTVPLFAGGKVVALSTHPLSQLIVAGDADGRVAVLDGSRGEVLRLWFAHDGPTEWVGLVADVQPAQVVTAGGSLRGANLGHGQESLAVWNAASGKQLGYRFVRKFHALDMEGRCLLTIDQGEGLRLWTVAGDGELREGGKLAVPTEAREVEFARARPDGGGAVLVLPNEVRFWATSSGEVWGRSRPFPSRITAVAWSPDDSLAVIGGGAGQLEVLSLAEIEQEAPLDLSRDRAPERASLLTDLLGYGLYAFGLGLERASTGNPYVLLDELASSPSKTVRGPRPIGAFSLDVPRLIVTVDVKGTSAAEPGVAAGAEGCHLSCTVLNLGMKPAKDVRLSVILRDGQGRALRRQEQRLGGVRGGASTGWTFPISLPERATEPDLTLEVVAEQAEGEPSRPVVVAPPPCP